jgi:hypothetical protein
MPRHISYLVSDVTRCGMAGRRLRRDFAGLVQLPRIEQAPILSLSENALLQTHLRGVLLLSRRTAVFGPFQELGTE